MADWRVELDVYTGPMDLLLFLIKRDELDIHDIPIARIAESYNEYVTALIEISRHAGKAGPFDINLVGDFLVMATTLMEIKSALLLPPDPDESLGSREGATPSGDPRAELVRQLIEYKRLRDAASILEERQQVFTRRFAHIPARAESDEPPPLMLDEVQIWDLFDAFSRLMKEVGTRSVGIEVISEDTPVELHVADIEDRLTREKTLSFRQLLLGRKNRAEMVGVFLAILELAKRNRISLHQASDFGDISIEAQTPPEPAPAAATVAN